MKLLKRVLLAGFIFYLPFQSMAWGVLGHRIIGGIAESYLSKHAAKRIHQILGNESLAMAANWADFIKSDPSYNYLSPWHYINLPDHLAQQQFDALLQADSTADAYTKLNFLVQELKKDTLAPATQLMYLRLLIHIAGDIHQPMHVSREEDLGGNKIKVRWFGDETNLHSLWDEKLINFQQLSYTEYISAINHTTRLQRTTWQQQPVSQWLFESYEISQQLYAEIKTDNPYLSFRYNFDHIATVNEQLLKGGVRLAGLLNEIFG